MLNSVTSGITSVIGWVGDIFEALLAETGAWSAVLPLIGVGVGLFIIGAAIGIVKSLIKGY